MRLDIDSVLLSLGGILLAVYTTGIKLPFQNVEISPFVLQQELEHLFSAHLLLLVALGTSGLQRVRQDV